MRGAIIGFIVIAVVVSFFGFVMFVYSDHNKKCSVAGGVAVNGGRDCWVEGRGFINPYK